MAERRGGEGRGGRGRNETSNERKESEKPVLDVYIDNVVICRRRSKGGRARDVSNNWNLIDSISC